MTNALQVPVEQQQQDQSMGISRRHNPDWDNLEVFEVRQTFRQGGYIFWGTNTEGIQPGDYIRGVLMGFEYNEYERLCPIIKSPDHNFSLVSIHGCDSIEKELRDGELNKPVCYHVGQAIQITFLYKRILEKGMGKGKMFGAFKIQGIRYVLNDRDKKDLIDFQKMQQLKQQQTQVRQPMPQMSQQPMQVPQQQPMQQFQNFQAYEDVPQFSRQPSYQQSATGVSPQQFQPQQFASEKKGNPFDVF